MINLVYFERREFECQFKKGNIKTFYNMFKNQPKLMTSLVCVKKLNDL